MLAPDWSWFAAVAIIFAVIALLWIPGMALASGLGAGWWPSLALAPVLTTSLVSVGGIVTAVVGIRWGLGTAFFWLLAVPALLWATRLLLIQTGRKRWRLEVPPVKVWELVVGLGVAVLIVGGIFFTATTRPGNIPQASDQIFHLGLVRYMLDAGNLSSLTADGFNNPDSRPFYPAAFHDVAAVMVQLTHAPIAVVENSLLLVSCALIYPLGIMFMLNTLVSTEHRLVLLTGFLSSIIIFFPWRTLLWGAVWSQLYSSAFIHGVIAVYGWGLLQVFRKQNWGSAALLVLAAVPGTTLSHPSAFFAVASGAILFSIAVSLQHAHHTKTSPGRWLPLFGFVLVGIIGPALGALAAPQGLYTTNTGDTSIRKVVVSVLTFWSPRDDRQQAAGFAIMALTLIGCVFLLRRRHSWWLAASAIIFLALGAKVAAYGPRYVWPLVWPWYSETFRIFGVAAVFVLPVMIVGVGWLLTLSRRMGRFGIPWIVLVSLALVPLLAVQLRSIHGSVKGSYNPASAKTAWIDDEKADALRELSRVMPADAVVAANPWRGGMFLYVIAPQRTVIPTEKSYGHDLELIQSGLKNVTTDRAVCGAVQRQNVTYVITEGTIVRGNDRWYFKYAAVDEVSKKGGFRMVATAGPYRLWTVPACQQ